MSKLKKTDLGKHFRAILSTDTTWKDFYESQSSVIRPKVDLKEKVDQTAKVDQIESQI